MLAVLIAAVTLTSVASAGPTATKQRVQITMKGLPNGEFVFSPLQSGPLKSDSGTVHLTAGSFTPRIVIRDGQSVSIYKPVVWQLEGKRGSLTIREPRNEWVETGDASIGTGTWMVVRGTGQYAGIAGGGRSAHAGMGREWFARQEGFLTLP